jgi:hypothetical protein
VPASVTIHPSDHLGLDPLEEEANEEDICLGEIPSEIIDQAHEDKH